MSVDPVRKAVTRAQLFGEAPIQVHHFQLLRWKGAGSMGAVYEAYDPRLDRRVAVKLLHPHLSDRAFTERIMSEARALARVTHPNVVTLHDVGRWEGRYFLAMELVDGVTLAEWQRGRTFLEVLEAYRGAGQGLEASHRAGLLHRDFKPANVLIGAEGRVRVVDFGLAESWEPSGKDGSEPPPGVGTPAYMAPEVANGAAVSQASDQYSFCLALAEALGQAQDDGEREREWVRLATVLRRGCEVLPARRWSSMGALLEAVEEAVPSPKKPVSSRRRLHLWAAAVAVGGLAGWMLTTREPQPSADPLLFRAAEQLVRDDPTDAAAALAEMRDWRRSTNGESLAQRVAAHGLAVRERRSLSLSGIRTLSPDGRWAIGGREGRSAPIVDMYGVYPSKIVDDVLAVHPDGRRLMQRAKDALVEIRLDVDGGRERRWFEGETVRAARYVGDGFLVLLATGELRTHTGTKSSTLRPAAPLPPGDAHIDGRGEVRILTSNAVETHGPTGEVLRFPLPAGPGSWRFIDEAEALVYRPGRETFELLGRNGRLYRLPGDVQRYGALGQSGAWIAAPGRSNVVRVWKLRTEGVDLVRTLPHPDRVVSLSFGPASRYLVAGTRGRVARVWDLERSLAQDLLGHRTPIEGVLFGRSPWEVLTTTAGGGTRFWRLLPKGGFLPLAGHQGGIWTAAYAPAGQALLTAAEDGTARLWSFGPPKAYRLDGHEGPNLFAAAISPTGRLMATGGDDGTARLWSREGRSLGVFGGHERWALSLAFSPDERTIATGSYSGVVRSFPVPQGAVDGNWRNSKTAPDVNPAGMGRVIDRHPEGGRVEALAFSQDGHRLASVSSDGSVMMHDLVRATSVLLGRHSDWVHDVRFVGALVVTASRDTTVKIWSAEDQGLVRTLRGHEGWVLRLAVSRDGQRMASASVDGTIRLWSVEGESQGVLRGHTDWVHAVDFDATGARLVSGSYDGTVRVWSVDTGKTTRVLTGHRKGVRFVAFGPGTDQVISAALDGTARIWTLGPRLTQAALEARIEAVARCLSVDHRLRFLDETKEEAEAALTRCQARRKGKSPSGKRGPS